MLGHRSTSTTAEVSEFKVERVSPKKEEQKVTLMELKLKPIKKVTFTEDTVDNEHMNKRKSKSKF